MGLFTRVNKDGSKVYGFRLWVGKREIRKTVGPSRRPAELALAKYKNDVREKK